MVRHILLANYLWMRKKRNLIKQRNLFLSNLELIWIKPIDPNGKKNNWGKSNSLSTIFKNHPCRGRRSSTNGEQIEKSDLGLRKMMLRVMDVKSKVIIYYELLLPVKRLIKNFTISKWKNCAKPSKLKNILNYYWWIDRTTIVVISKRLKRKLTERVLIK